MILCTVTNSKFALFPTNAKFALYKAQLMTSLHYTKQMTGWQMGSPSRQIEVRFIYTEVYTQGGHFGNNVVNRTTCLYMHDYFPCPKPLSVPCHLADPVLDLPIWYTAWTPSPIFTQFISNDIWCQIYDQKSTNLFQKFRTHFFERVRYKKVFLWNVIFFTDSKVALSSYVAPNNGVTL